MASQNISLPFSLSNVYGGFAKVKGLIHVHRNSLGIDYQSEDSIVGLVKSKPQEIEIPYTEIQFVELKTNLFTTRLILRVSSLAAIADFPKPSSRKIPAGEMRLSLKRSDRERARQAVSYINLRLSEIRLDKMDGEDLY